MPKLNSGINCGLMDGPLFTEAKMDMGEDGERHVSARLHPGASGSRYQSDAMLLTVNVINQVDGVARAKAIMLQTSLCHRQTGTIHIKALCFGISAQHWLEPSGQWSIECQRPVCSSNSRNPAEGK